MSLSVTHWIIFFSALFGFSGCELSLSEEDIEEEIEDIQNSDEVQEIIEACGDLSLAELQTTNFISEACKNAINHLLPETQGNIGPTDSGTNSDTSEETSVTVTTTAIIENDQALIVMGTGTNGQILNIHNAAELSVFADGIELPQTAFTTVTASDVDTRLFSFSAVLDYSSSMSDRDIDDAIEIFDLLFSVPVRFEAAYSIFSETVHSKIGFTSNTADLFDAIQRDNDYIRHSTALFDAMGNGLNDIALRDAPIKLLFVATDGGENASTTYTNENQLFALAKESNTHIIAMGALFSDVQFLKRAAKETNGYYLYSRSFLALQDQMTTLVEILQNTSAIKITDPAFQNAGAYQVIADGATFDF